MIELSSGPSCDARHNWLYLRSRVRNTSEGSKGVAEREPRGTGSSAWRLRMLRAPAANRQKARGH